MACADGDITACINIGAIGNGGNNAAAVGDIRRGRGRTKQQTARRCKGSGRCHVLQLAVCAAQSCGTGQHCQAADVQNAARLCQHIGIGCDGDVVGPHRKTGRSGHTERITNHIEIGVAFDPQRARRDCNRACLGAYCRCCRDRDHATRRRQREEADRDGFDPDFGVDDCCADGVDIDRSGRIDFVRNGIADNLRINGVVDGHEVLGTTTR